jgi:tetratricopeptide (TPR) repeat protein
VRRAALLAGTALLLSPAGDACAEGREKPKPRTRQVQALGEWAFRKLSAAQRQLADEEYAACLATLDDMKRREALGDHERALMWQTYAYVYAAQERYREAAGAFEQCLALHALPEGARLDTQYNLAQLYVVLEEFGTAVELFGTWIAVVETPAPGAHYMYALAAAQHGQQDLAVAQALLAVTKAAEPKEAWLQLLLSLYLQRTAYREAVGVLERLVERFPRKAYWTQLSAVYSELGEHRKALAALEIAYGQGMLTEGRELVTLAQLYLYNEIPYKAAQVLEAGLAREAIASDAEAWELLATSWLSARERRKAIDPLERAARLSESGELYARLANVHLDQEDYAAARSSLASALRKGKLKDPGNTQLLLGIASATDEQWDEAKRAFEAAAGYGRTREAAERWLEHLEREIEAERGVAVPAADTPRSPEGASAETPSPSS